MKYASKGNKRKKVSLFFFDVADVLVSSIVIVAIVFTFLFRVITVDGPSMTPNYVDGGKVLVSSWTTSPKLGDVVIITDVLEAGPIIKRVIATEGQTVDFDTVTKSVVVDGVQIDDSQFGVESGITEVIWQNYEMLNFPQVVPKGYVFVLGDNRIFSKDSRFAEIGMIDKRKILGKALVNIYPFKTFGAAK
ncbi:signal peptidase I [Scatolibacter rhodanostii]|uniref:signal peptidase I n=1 Tax=Scatolibacter rhodanostii TaxID=2014781 RepID=UPI000C07991B|nr:signal peptidase I [Scatolibacter rhodanostii]